MVLLALSNFSRITFIEFGGTKNGLLLVRNIEKCLCADINNSKRYKAKWNSKFPKENGVTRLEKLSEKLNPPPSERERNVPLPGDIGNKLDSTNQIFSEYVPLSNKSFILTRLGMSQRWEAIKATLLSTYAVAMIKRKAKPFKVVDFSKLAQQKFIDVNNALQQIDKRQENLMKEHATLMVIRSLKTQYQDPSKQLHWRFVKEVERPKVVHARVASLFDKDNLFAQVTVRIHTEQILAIKDRYNRTITGDARQPKKVIDYVVFERHLTDPYGRWRICGKINPPSSAQKAIARAPNKNIVSA